MVWAFLIGFFSLIGIKVFQPVMEYNTIQSMVTKVARDGGNSVPEIRSAFSKLQAVEYGVESIRAQDLEITKEDERIVVRFAYEKEIELFGPVSLLLKFKGQSK
jgi:hypothetical protein